MQERAGQEVAPREAGYNAFCEQMGLPYVRLREVEAKAALRERVSPPVAHRYWCLPVEPSSGTVKVAVSDPFLVAGAGFEPATFGLWAQPFLLFCGPFSTV